jgi:putative DNA primase/helicase
MEENNEISDVVVELKKKLKIYFDGNKFLSSILAGDIVFKDFDSVLQTGENRGYLVIDSKDSEILYYKDGVYIENGEQRIREIAQWVLGDKSASHKLAEVVSAVKNFSKIRVKREKLNSYLTLVNLKNCIVNTETLEMIPHSKDYYFTVKLDFDYKQDATCPAIMKFLNEVHKPDDIPLIQELFGYCLYPTYIYHYIFFLIGMGRNGKGTELTLLTNFLGSKNTTSRSPSELNDDPYAVADLDGKMADICGEIGSEPLKTHVLKRGSGMDIMTGQHKFGHAFDYVNHAKFIYATNLPPPIQDRSTGIWNRLIFIDFPNAFPLGGPTTDPELISKLITPDELSGLFNWAIIGLQRLKKQGRVSFNFTTEETMRWYDRKANPTLAFAQDMLDYSEGEYVLKSTIRRLFTEYCKKHSLQVVGDAWFSKKLCDALPGCDIDRPTIDGRRQPVFLNIRLKNESDSLWSPKPIEPHTPQKKLDFKPSLEDKINQLLTCLEMYEYKLTDEQLEEQGFSKEFIAKCIEQGIIHIKPDKTVGV